MKLDELDSARAWMLVLGRKTASERVASLIIFLARRSAAAHGGVPVDRCEFDMPFSRNEMADYLSLSLETVSRHVADFRRRGLLDFDRRRSVVILDLRTLLDESGDDSDGGVIP